MRRRTRRASGSLQGKRRTPYRQETGVGTRAENPGMANPRGARRRRAWRHLVSTAALPIVGLGVNRTSMEQFSYYEGPLATAINHLISGVVDAHTWLTVLVRFVAGLLVRGPDFNRRFLRRFSDSFRAELAKLDPVFYGRDNTNFARILEHQRLLAPICGAAWTVLGTSGGVEQITNDLGFIGFEHVQTQYRGIAVPLDRHHILTLTPRLQAILAIAKAGTWVPEIRFGKLSDEQ